MNKSIRYTDALYYYKYCASQIWWRFRNPKEAYFYEFSFV